jgi:Fic family protein
MPGTRTERIWPSDPTRDAPPKHRAACRYETFSPNLLVELRSDLSLELAGLVSEAEQELRRLNDEGGEALRPLARLLLRTESIASSKVEGLQMLARDVARAEARHATGEKIGTTAQDLIGNIDAMSLALEHATEATTLNDAALLDIHRRLMEKGPFARIAGKFRTTQNWIGGNDYTPCGADFVPPPPEEMPALLADLYAAMSAATLPPLIQAAFVHAQFETIHPFDDGNGRTGRALVHIVLRRRRVAPHFVPPISIIFANSRARYINGLTSFRADDVTGWLQLFAEATISAARLARRYVAKVTQLRDEWHAALGERESAPRGGATAWSLIDLLVGYPIISAPMVTPALGRTPASVYEAIDQLVRAGVLIPLTTGKRNRSWEARGLLDLIEAMERGE